MDENRKYSDYIIFIDESGDHGLQTIDEKYPIFALVFVLIKKQDYFEKIVPRFIELKFKYWGHDQIILHEHDIRKEKQDFGLLRTSRTLRESFYEDLNTIIKEIPFEFIGAVIKKEKLKKKYSKPFNPYEIAMLFCMEESLKLLEKRNRSGKITHLIVEGRGAEEDKKLELEFRRICANQKTWGYQKHDFSKIPFEFICSHKRSNSSGLQLADLIARPIGLKYLRPDQDNRAFEIIRNKLKFIKCFP
ncbi:MAG: DUF3800 domain-containing protein [Alphaproteobacteria bacterium]|jgi:hypothetical protein